MREAKGIVLIVVLVIMSILMILLYQGVKIANIQLNTTYLLKQFFIAKHRAISGINYAKAILIADSKKGNCDTEMDVWNNIYMVQEYIPSDIGPQYVNVRIEDESSKIPINYLVDKQKGKIYQKIVKRLLVDKIGVDSNRAENVIKEIKNWINPHKYPLEEISTINPYYEDHEYVSKGGVFKTLGELLFLPSVDKKLYFGSKGQIGLKDIFTVYSDNGKININTCKKSILFSLISDDIDREEKNRFVAHILKIRKDSFYKEMLCDKNWIEKRKQGYKNIEIPYKILKINTKYFKIISTGIAGSFNCTIIKFVEREKNYIKSLYTIEF